MVAEVRSALVKQLVVWRPRSLRAYFDRQVSRTALNLLDGIDRRIPDELWKQISSSMTITGCILIKVKGISSTLNREQSDIDNEI